jgi:hypothetical protein
MLILRTLYVKNPNFHDIVSMPRTFYISFLQISIYLGRQSMAEHDHVNQKECRYQYATVLCNGLSLSENKKH